MRHINLNLFGKVGSQAGIRRSLVYGLMAGVILTLFMSACGEAATEGDQAATESTLDRVLRTGELKVGVLAAIPPYGDFDENNEFVGYDRDIAQLIADDLGAELVLEVLGDPAARVTSLVSGQLDLISAGFSLTPERSQSVAFSVPYAPDLQVLLGRVEDADIQSVNDLAGKRVAIVTGTTQEVITDLAPDAEVVRVADIAASQQAFESGQADVFVVDDATAAAMIAEDPSLERKGTVFQGFLALGLPRDDTQWLRFVNDSLIWHGGAGDIQILYLKHFGVPMPKILPDF